MILIFMRISFSFMMWNEGISRQCNRMHVDNRWYKYKNHVLDKIRIIMKVYFCCISRAKGPHCCRKLLSFHLNDLKLWFKVDDQVYSKRSWIIVDGSKNTNNCWVWLKIDYFPATVHFHLFNADVSENLPKQIHKIF